MTAPVTSPHGNAAGGQPEKPPGVRLRHCLPLGRWGGVTVCGHWSVLVTLALFADVLAVSALPAAQPGRGSLAYWLAGSLTAAVFVVTVLAHELAHAVVARHYRMPVRRITLWALGGMTDLGGESPTPRADALVALAGPLTSLGVGAVSALLAWAVGGSGLLGAALAWLAGISVLLGVFNLLPGAPLDGGRLLRALLWRHYRDRASAERSAAVAGRTLGILLVALGFLEFLAGGFAGLWLALIGWFIMSGAATEAESARVDRLRGLRAEDVMTPARVVVAEWWTVQQLLAQLTPDQVAQPVFPLVDFGGQASGAVTLADLERVPAEHRADTRIRDVTRRPRPMVVPHDALLADIVTPMRLHGGIAVVTAAENRPIGVITSTELVRAARLAELGWHGQTAPA